MYVAYRRYWNYRSGVEFWQMLNSTELLHALQHAAILILILLHTYFSLFTQFYKSLAI